MFSFKSDFFKVSLDSFNFKASDLSIEDDELNPPKPFFLE